MPTALALHPQATTAVDDTKTVAPESEARGKKLLLPLVPGRVVKPRSIWCLHVQFTPMKFGCPSRELRGSVVF